MMIEQAPIRLAIPTTSAQRAIQSTSIRRMRTSFEMCNGFANQQNLATTNEVDGGCDPCRTL